MNSTQITQGLKGGDILNPPFNDLKPFYKAIIYNLKQDFDLTLLFKRVKLECNKENSISERHFYTFDEEYVEERLAIFTVIHKSIPTWLANRKVSHNKTDFPKWENIETNLVILYISSSYLFLSSTDEKISTFFQHAISTFDGSTISILETKKLLKTRAFKGGKAKILGLRNTFGQGGVGRVPQTKSYTGKDCKRSLNGVTDHVFRLSHISSTDEEGSYSGGSVKRKKVWGTWVHGLDDYINSCESYVLELTDESTIDDESPLKCLAQPQTVEVIREKKPIAFFLNSMVKNKGVVGFKFENDEYLDWETELSVFEKNQIKVSVNTNNDESIDILIRFEMDESGVIEFSYDDKNIIEPNIVFFNEDTPEIRGRDFVKYLNSNQEFSFLFPGGIAYADNSCWKLDKLSNCFFDRSDASINWSNVDITKEEKPTGSKKLNILQKLQEYSLGLPNLLFAINDNGANEVADLILLFKGKVVFVHAKFSKNPIPKLRVDDIQTVVSQAIKNINFSVPEPYSEKQIVRLYNNCFSNPQNYTLDEFSNYFLQTLEDYADRKEVWIVQPGISKTKLESNPSNKIHTLLSYTETQLNAAQIEFKFLCSK